MTEAIDTVVLRNAVADSLRGDRRRRTLGGAGMVRLAAGRMEPEDLRVLDAIEAYADGLLSRSAMNRILKLAGDRYHAASLRSLAAAATAGASRDHKTRRDEDVHVRAHVRLAVLRAALTATTATHPPDAIATHLVQAPLAAARDIVAVAADVVRPDVGDAAWPPASAGVREMATTIYADRSFEDMPILADALEDAGVNNGVVLRHCRFFKTHCRGCWVLDELLDHGLKKRLLREALLKGGV